MFTWVLGVLDDTGLIKGKTIGVDATTLEANAAMRSIVRRDDERKRQKWKGQAAQQAAVYANRRRKNGHRGKELMRLRGELIERPFAHAIETGGMRRTHLRHHGTSPSGSWSTSPACHTPRRSPRDLRGPSLTRRI